MATKHAGGGGLCNADHSVSQVVNSIFWQNTSTEIENQNEAKCGIHHSLIRGGFAGMGNIARDPLFVDAESGNWQLLPDSPCIDAGYPVDKPDVDIAGVPRPQGAAIDIGAYEFKTSEKEDN